MLELLIAGDTFHNVPEMQSSNVDLGLKEILKIPDICSKIIKAKFNEALEIIRATYYSEYPKKIPNVEGTISWSSCRATKPMGDPLVKIIKKYGERIQLKESDRKPKTSSKKKGKKQSSVGFVCRDIRSEKFDDWQGPPPWELSLGGDGCPRFLCDVMVSNPLLFLYKFYVF